jgi:hypothetical protein
MIFSIATLGIMTLGIATLTIMAFNIITFSKTKLSIMAFSIILSIIAECRYDACPRAVQFVLYKLDIYIYITLKFSGKVLNSILQTRIIHFLDKLVDPSDP